jgi:hypothetical protein
MQSLSGVREAASVVVEACKSFACKDAPKGFCAHGAGPSRNKTSAAAEGLTVSLVQVNPTFALSGYLPAL